MKKTNLLALIFYLILINIYAVSAQAESISEINMFPATKTVIQKYPDYAVGTIKPTSVPENSRIIIAKYKDNICVSAEIREYLTDTESFNITNDIDTVKIMLWDSLNGMKPISQAEVITTKATTDAEKKVEEISKKLITEKNTNVITYKTEENEPRAIIWTKGIQAPLMAEFKRETEITDPSYSFLYVGQEKGKGWYDVNKSRPEEDSRDRTMCFAAVSANQLHWWLDQNKDNIDKYLNNLANGELTSEQQQKISKLQELRNSFNGQSDSGIYKLFKNYFYNYSANANLLNDFFINGYQVNTKGYVNSPSFFEMDSRGGFFHDVFEKKILTDRLSAGDYKAFKQCVIDYMQDGQSIGIVHQTPTQGMTHIITLWGIEIDSKNEITALFVTDSDDYEQKYIGMKRMYLKKNSSGYPIISTKMTDNNSGAKIIELVPLSLGIDDWNDFINKSE